MLTVVDVYDLAAAIGKDFEFLIDRFGVDAVTSLMPKVISVLEELEELATRHENESNQLSGLQTSVTKLETEKLARAGDRLKFEQELEQIEEAWRSETRDLLDMVHKLEEENRRLQELQNEVQVAAAPGGPGGPQSQSKLTVASVVATVAAGGTVTGMPTASDLEVMSRLKASVDKQRDQLRALRRECAQKAIDNEALQAQVERLAKLNSELRRKHCVTRRLGQALIEERSDLELQLQAKEQIVRNMRELTESAVGSGSSDGSLGSAPHSPGAIGLTDEQFIERLNAEGKMVVDIRDPNRPRFTLHELKEVLLERNELKTRLFEVEDELQMYRKAGDEDAPVQGPLPREPDEKLRWDKVNDMGDSSNTGIKQFFLRLFTPSNRLKSRQNHNCPPESKFIHGSPVDLTTMDLVGYSLSDEELEIIMPV